MTALEGGDVDPRDAEIERLRALVDELERTIEAFRAGIPEAVMNDTGRALHYPKSRLIGKTGGRKEKR